MFKSILFLSMVLVLTYCKSKGDYVFKKSLVIATYKESHVIASDDFSETLEKDGHLLKVKLVKPDKMQTVKNLMDLHIKDLFATYASPYPGVVSHKVVCPTEFHPLEYKFRAKAGDFSGYKFYANSRFVAGECIADDIKYAYFRGLFKCRDTTYFYDIEFFIPKNNVKTQGDFEFLLNSLQCE